jgi:hypothetical protein
MVDMELKHSFKRKHEPQTQCLGLGVGETTAAAGYLAFRYHQTVRRPAGNS